MAPYCARTGPRASGLALAASSRPCFPTHRRLVPTGSADRPRRRSRAHTRVPASCRLVLATSQPPLLHVAREIAVEHDPEAERSEGVAEAQRPIGRGLLGPLGHA